MTRQLCDCMGSLLKQMRFNMGYLSKGQYRKVQDTDSGCSIWFCLWCKQSLETRDNPERSRWCGCPFCLKSWFTKLQCRDHHTPRWYYDRWGNEPTCGIKVITTIGEFEPDDLRYYSRNQEPKRWYFEYRSKCPESNWEKWQYEYSYQWSPINNYVFARQILEQFRLQHLPRYRGDIDFEYRARLI